MAVYCHPAYLAYMYSISFEIPGWMKHKLESNLCLIGRNINNLRYADDTTLMAESKEKLKSLAYNSTLKKLTTRHSNPSLNGNTREKSDSFSFLGLQNH